MLLEFFTGHEGQCQSADYGLFFRRERFRILGVDRWKKGIKQRIFGAVERNDATGVVNFGQEQAIVHLVLRTPADNGTFQLELDNGNGFLHLRHQPDLLGTEITVGVDLGDEAGARIILVSCERKGG